YRLDLLNPSRSDRWNFVPQCKDDHEFASQMAATMIGLEGTKHSFADPFWQESELLLLTAVLLHLSDVVDNPTPPMVYEYLGMRGTAIYVVVAEGDATRYKNVLSTFFGQAVNQLRIDRREHDVAPVTFCLDEAANVPLVGLKEIAGVGRGRKIGLILGYQNLPQVQDQYNHDGANAILGSIG